MPAIPTGTEGDTLVATINDRLRRLQSLIAQAPSAVVPTRTQPVATSSGGAAPSELVLAVPGVLGIIASAAPLVSLPEDATPTEIVALVKTAPVGAALTLQVLAGSSQVAIVVIAAGAVSASVPGGATIPAESVITLAITTVGTTFPGSDLTVMVRF
jgi:hypothetical protein